MLNTEIYEWLWFKVSLLIRELIMMRNKLDSNSSVKGFSCCFVSFGGSGEEVGEKRCYACYSTTISASHEFNHTPEQLLLHICGKLNQF